MLARAKRGAAEDLLLSHCGITELQEKQVLRSLRSHQDDPAAFVI